MDILPTQRSKAVGRANAVIEPLEALASQLKCQKTDILRIPHMIRAGNAIVVTKPSAMNVSH